MPLHNMTCNTDTVYARKVPQKHIHSSVYALLSRGWILRGGPHSDPDLTGMGYADLAPERASIATQCKTAAVLLAGNQTVELTMRSHNTTPRALHVEHKAIVA